MLLPVDIAWTDACLHTQARRLEMQNLENECGYVLVLYVLSNNKDTPNNVY